MKHQAADQQIPFGKALKPLLKILNAVILLTITIVLVALFSLHMTCHDRLEAAGEVAHQYYHFYPISFLWKKMTTFRTSPLSSGEYDDDLRGEEGEILIVSNAKCDIFTGEWVPNPKAPYYTNDTCWAIHEHQNCMKYGRPDDSFMRWRWKPDGCELPVFNPAQFLEIVRGKSLAFVGDSVGRNQMQSLICLLSKVEYPIDVSPTADEYFKRWKYTSYNFTMATFWTPHLVRSQESDPDGPTSTGLFTLHLDEPDPSWTGEIHRFDYVILSAGHWFFRPMIFRESGKITGCHYCLKNNITDLTMYYGYRKAFRTAFRSIVNNRALVGGGVVFLRTFAPSHFENGLWNEGGNCLRTAPFRRNETRLEGGDMEMYMIQMEEYRAAEKEAKEKGIRFRVLDTTQAMLMRPDGHPSRYGHWAHENVTLYNDCVHWCLPGPIDTWSDFLLEMLKMEGRRAFEEKQLRSRPTVRRKK